jgi:hypothetical protein
MKKIIIIYAVIFITACSTQSSLTPKEKIYLTIDIRKQLILEEVYKNVKDKLKYPEEAEFKNEPEYIITSEKDKRVIARGYVIAKNGFGVREKLSYDVVFIADDNSPYVERVSIE